MLNRERPLAVRTLLATLLAAFTTALLAPSLTQPAGAAIPNPCDLPGIDLVCDTAGQAAAGAAKDVGEYVMRGVTSWVTDTAVWVTGKVGDLINATASPDVQADWFRGQYQAMLTVAGALALPMLILAVIQAVLRQDIWILLRSAFGFLPLAFILAAAAIVATQLIINITDDLSQIIVESLGTGTSSNLLQSVGDAYTQALNDTSGGAVPLFGIFLGAIILAIGAFVLWLELIIRDAAVYIALFFIPLTFVAMIWPATSRWARRLVELLIAIVLSKFVIVSIISLASAAITNTTLANTTSNDSGGEFERMIAGSALLVLAAWSPFALLRLIPMMEATAATITSQRSSISNAAGSAGIQSPAAYMRQAIDRHSRSSEPAPSGGSARTFYTAETARASGAGAESGGSAGSMRAGSTRTSDRTNSTVAGETRAEGQRASKRSGSAASTGAESSRGASAAQVDPTPPAAAAGRTRGSETSDEQRPPPPQRSDVPPVPRPQGEKDDG